jgi:hypothetical protein
MIQESLSENHTCDSEFKNRLDGIILQVNQLGINAKLFWENDSLEDTVSICPISAKTGEGVGDLLELLTRTSQPDYEEELKCIVMEKPPSLEGLGAVVDVIVINGTLKKNDKIVISTSHGPVETIIKHLLTPPPNRESRVKSEYINNESVTGAIGVKLVATELNNIILKAFEFDQKHDATFFRSNDIWKRGREISKAVYEKEYIAPPLLMEETTIGSEIIDTNQHFIFLYDFLKSWTFLIELIQVIKNADADISLEYPIVSRIEGVGPMQYGTKGLLGKTFADIEEKYDLSEAKEGFGEEGEDAEDGDKDEEDDDSAEDSDTNTEGGEFFEGEAF